MLNKNLYLILLSFIGNSTFAQTLYSFSYKVNDMTYGSKQGFEIKTNDDYIFYQRTGVKDALWSYQTTRLFDTKNNVCILTPVDQKRQWYLLENINKMYHKSTESESDSEKKKIGNFNCDKHLVNVEGGVWTIWTTEDVKITSELSKYLVALLTNNLISDDLGFVVKIDYEYYDKKGKVISSGDISLIEASETKLADVFLPWTNDAYKAAITYTTESDGSRDTQRKDGRIERGTSSKIISCLWTADKSTDYETRLRNLVLKVTGQEVKEFVEVIGIARY